MDSRGARCMGRKDSTCELEGLTNVRVRCMDEFFPGGSMNKPLAEAPGRPVSLTSFREHRKKLRNVNKEASNKLSTLDRLACWITDRVGTMGFFLTVLIWTVIWLAWNLLVPRALQFDPPMALSF